MGVKTFSYLIVFGTCRLSTTWGLLPLYIPIRTSWDTTSTTESWNPLYTAAAVRVFGRPFNGLTIRHRVSSRSLSAPSSTSSYKMSSVDNPQAPAQIVLGYLNSQLATKHVTATKWFNLYGKDDKDYEDHSIYSFLPQRCASTYTHFQGTCLPGPGTATQ